MSSNDSAPPAYMANSMIHNTSAVVHCSAMCIASTETKNDTVTTHCNHRCHRVCFTQHPLRFITCPSCGSPLSVSVGITPQQAVSNINGAIGALEVAAKELKEAARKMDKMTRKAEKKQKQMKKRIFAQEYESEDGP